MISLRLILLSILIIAINFSCKEKKKEKKKTFLDIKSSLEHIYTCGAEKLTDDNSKFDCGNNFICSGVNTRTDEKIRSGKYSVKLSTKSPYSMTSLFEDIKSGEYFEISVWYYGKEGKSKIVASDMTSEKIYLTESKVSKIENGWKLIKFNFSIPAYETSNSLKIYLYSQSETPVYFDDLEIKRYNVRPQYKDESAIFLEYNKEDYELLRDNKTEALGAFVLDSKNKKWIKAKFSYKKNKSKVKIRFKGDWVDHISGDKWSFRIKMKEESWKNMRVFSIQSPVVRDFMHEWILHKLFEYEDVLTTRYDFVPVYVNNLYKGIYAYEEHFAKQLIESRKRREGPIIKFNEDDMFFKSKLEFKSNQNVKLPIIEASDVLPFGETKILADSNLTTQFEIAQNLLNAYKNNLLSVEEIFNLESIAKYFAIISLTKSYHSLAWHNQRFYYNPITQKLEIIGYDGGDPNGYSYHWVKPSIFGNFEFLHGINNINYDVNLYNFNLNLFKNKNFLELYIKSLEKYSSIDFINEFQKNIEGDFEQVLKKLNSEYPDYNYDLNKLYTNAENIKSSLDDYKKIISEPNYLQKFNIIKTPVYDKKYDDIYETIMLKAYKKHLNNDSIQLQVVSYIPRGMYLFGIEDEKKQIKKFEKPIPVSKFEKTPSICQIACQNGKYLLYYSQQKDSIYKIAIHNWQMPTTDIPYLNLKANNYFSHLQELDDVNKIVSFSGEVKLTNNLVIPAGYKVVFAKGTHFNLLENAVFISYSPIQINGTKENPVVITSSDGLSKGFTILQANEKSILNNVVFDGLNSLNYQGWTLTGAVTFYESEVEFNNCIFKNNQSEDALNVIRSEFTMNNCNFENIYSDAFDSDFSKGKITNSTFKNIKNDAIDFSGSFVNIENCNIEKIGDKGISGGENSKMKINNVQIANCNIGIASKDLSVLEVDNSTIQNCNYGFVLLQKKPEYGDASLFAKDVNINNNITNYLIEKGSTFMLNGEKIKGKDKKIADIFY